MNRRNIDPETGEIIKRLVRTPYNYDTDKASDETGLDTGTKTETQQQFKDECDINEIVRRFGLTGTVPENYRPPVSGDFTGVTDFQTAMNAVRQAQETFMELPAELRYRFNNDPGRLIDFVSDATNRDEALKLGLLQPPVERSRDGHHLPLRVEVVQSEPPQPANKEPTK